MEFTACFKGKMMSKECYIIKVYRYFAGQAVNIEVKKVGHAQKILILIDDIMVLD